MNLKEIIKPFPDKKTKIYGTITGRNIISGDDNWFVTFDLVNEEVRKIDAELYLNVTKENLKKNNSKEYLFTYFMTMEIDIKQYSSHFEPLSEKLLYEFDIIPEAQFVDNGNGIFHESDIYFSASPIEKKKFFASFTGVTLPLKAASLLSLGISPIINQPDIDSALNDIFTYDLKAKVFRAHRVGQGSCNSIIFKLQDDNKLFYDIGISKYSNADSYYNTYKARYSMFNMDKFSTIIISHWDEDHYMGIYLDACRNLLSKKWITPLIQDNWFNAKRLAYLISIYGQIVMIDDSIHGNFYKKDDMHLFKGDGTGKNNSGIIVCLKNSVKNLVVMGDVSYRNSRFILSYLGGIFSAVDNLIVPHHGAYLTPSISFTSRTAHSTAIISVGYNSFPTPHPNPNTLSDLSTAGFRVLTTDLNERQIIEF